MWQMLLDVAFQHKLPQVAMIDLLNKIEEVTSKVSPEDWSATDLFYPRVRGAYLQAEKKQVAQMVGSAGKPVVCSVSATY